MDTGCFWSNEAGEPIHVHVCQGELVGSATSIWLPSENNSVVADNNSNQGFESYLENGCIKQG